jgi:SNF2 family DNA or RNA helicase
MPTREAPLLPKQEWSISLHNMTPVVTCTKHVLCTSCKTNTMTCPTCLSLSLEGQKVFYEYRDWRHSSKTLKLLQIVQHHLALDSGKIVVFSQWTTCLDLIENMLTFYSIPTCRFDGSLSSMDERTETLKEFSQTDTNRVMLTSLGAGGEGINLTCADTVVLLEPYWNVAVEQQAIDRVHRLGQTRQVHVYRLMLQDSIEDWVLCLQESKFRQQVFYLSGTGSAQSVDNQNSYNRANKFQLKPNTAEWRHKDRDTCKPDLSLLLNFVEVSN